MSKVSKKRKLKSKVKKILLYTISLALITYGGTTLYFYYSESEEQTKQNEIVVEEFEEEVKSQDPSSVEEATGEEHEIAIGGKVVGVMYIPAFNDFKHAIAMGVSNDVLHDYIGMYTSYGMIGEENSNAVFSSHSALYGYSPISYFNRIDDVLKEGDTISILWNDGITYTYKVVSVRQYCSPTDKEAFEQPEDGQQYITLQTCTHGDSNYRSFIKAIRV